MEGKGNREKEDEGTGNRQQGTGVTAAARAVGVAFGCPRYTDAISTTRRAAPPLRSPGHFNSQFPIPNSQFNKHCFDGKGAGGNATLERIET